MRYWTALAWCLTVALAACGGGGGGSDAGTGTGGTGASTTSGLVPAAPQLGETLATDARSLRPLTADGRWEYSGTSIGYTGATPVAYSSTTTHSSLSGTSASETSSNSGNTGPDVQRVDQAGGNVTVPLSVDFAGKGTPQAFDFIELRSPVRTGDQYVMVDRHYTDTNIDADRDGKADALDVAVYARVMGRETVLLPNLPSVSAVRVDTLVLSRITASSTGAPLPVQQTSFKTWYAAGVGIVRQVVTNPAAISGDVSVTDERLTSFDAGRSGLGVMPSVDAVIPAGSTSFPGQTIPPNGTFYAFPYDSYALVFTDAPAGVLGTLATRLDLRGQVLDSALLTNLRMGGGGLALASSSGVAYLEPSTFGAVQEYWLTRLDTLGRMVGSARSVTLNLRGNHIGSYVERLAGAADGNTLWLAWSRPYYDPGNGNVPGTELVLRAYGFDGTPLGAEQILDTRYSGNSIQVAAGGGQAIVTWVRDAPGREVNYATAALGAQPVLRTLGAGQESGRTTLTPLRASGTSVLLWPAPLLGATSFGVSSGVVLDAASNPVLAGNGLAAEVLTGLPPFFSAATGPASGAPRVVGLATGTEFLLPGDPFTQAVDTLAWIDAGTSALSSSRLSVVRMAGRRPIGQAAFSDRVLVFGGTDRLKTSVVWLNNGQ